LLDPLIFQEDDVAFFVLWHQRTLRRRLQTGRSYVAISHAFALELFDLGFVPVANLIDAHGDRQNAGLDPPINGAVYNAIALL
jgi:hypothetical protein